MFNDQDDRTVHLLPPAQKDSKDWYGSMRQANAISIPNAMSANCNRGVISPSPEEIRYYGRNFIGPKQENEPHDGPRVRILVPSISGRPRKSKKKKKNTNHRLNRYGAILVDSEGKRRVGKIITDLGIEEWAKKHGFTVERSFKLSGSVDPDKEHTEITD